MQNDLIDAESGLPRGDVEKIKNVFADHPEIYEVILYGSRAKGNPRPGSDIDLTLRGSNLNLKSLNSLGLELDDLLLPYSFDLSIYHRIKEQSLIDHIQRVGKIFYRKSP